MYSYYVHMDSSRQVAVNVRHLMECKELSISETAKLSAIAYTTLQRKLNGGGDFTIAELGRLADALMVHPAELLPEAFVSERAA